MQTWRDGDLTGRSCAGWDVTFVQGSVNCTSVINTCRFCEPSGGIRCISPMSRLRDNLNLMVSRVPALSLGRSVVMSYFKPRRLGMLHSMGRLECIHMLT